MTITHIFILSITLFVSAIITLVYLYRRSPVAAVQAFDADAKADADKVVVAAKADLATVVSDTKGDVTKVEQTV